MRRALSQTIFFSPSRSLKIKKILPLLSLCNEIYIYLQVANDFLCIDSLHGIRGYGRQTLVIFYVGYRSPATSAFTSTKHTRRRCSGKPKLQARLRFIGVEAHDPFFDSSFFYHKILVFYNLRCNLTRFRVFM